MVYFIEGTTTKLIKIGFTKSKFLYDRLLSLQTGSPDILKVIAIIPTGTPRDEYVLHLTFKEARHHGEWFNPVTALLEHINHIKTKHSQTLPRRLISGGKKEQENYPSLQSPLRFVAPPPETRKPARKSPTAPQLADASKYTEAQLKFPSVRAKVGLPPIAWEEI